MNSIRGKCLCGWALLATLVVLTLVGAPGAKAAVGVSDREADPIVLTGSQAPALIGTAPDRIVAFRWDGAWVQVPVQVDERKIADYRVIRQWSMSQPEFKAEVYADPNTYTGADGVPQMSVGSPSVPVPGTAGDPSLDQDDEIAMMSKDAGDSAADEADPAGVDGSTRTPIRIKDPLEPQALRYLYLFRTTSAALDPAAGTDYVSYDWNFEPALVPGYFPDPGNPDSGYNFQALPGGNNPSNPGDPVANPEASSVETDLYGQSFPARWMVDGLKIKAGSATGVDILDGDKSTVRTDNCNRNELTFSRGGGGFIAAIDGPVRAIRSYIGANSGPFTQRDQTYYQGRVDTVTSLRVHPGIDYLTTAMDYSEAARGMIYRNSLNPAGVMIDGLTDTPVAGRLAWEQVTGEPGSATLIGRVDSDISPLDITSFYQDEEDPGASSMLCSGDQRAYGASGPQVIGSGAYNTDPVRIAEFGHLKNLTARRYTYVDPPGTTQETAILRSQQVDSPLVLATGAGSDPTGKVPDPGPNTPGKPGRTNWVGLKVSVKPAQTKARIGAKKVFRVRVTSIGDLPAKRLKVCVKGKRRLFRANRCRTKKALRAGKSVRFRIRATLRRKAARRKMVKLRFRAKAKGSKARFAAAVLRVRPRR